MSASGHRDARRVTHAATPGLPDAGMLAARPHAVTYRKLTRG